MRANHLILLATLGLLLALPAAQADTLELKDGSSLTNCYIRDEGIRLTVWEKMADVGTSKVTMIPRSKVKSFKIDRDAAWDVHPDLPDLSVTFIEMNPKRVSLHGHVDHDILGRPIVKGGLILDLGDRTALEPEEATKNLKLAYKPGEEITLTAHVRNVGFKPAEPFDFVWLIDGKEIGKGRCKKPLKEMEETTFSQKWKWEDGHHSATFRIVSTQPEIAVTNNEVTDPLWGWGYIFIVSNGRVKAWHQQRTAAGTFCFEDYYRWHVDLMNTLFAESKYPAAPDGIRARVRLDRIVYTDDMDQAQKDRQSPDGMYYDQGGWSWIDDQDKNKKWNPPPREWINGTEWSLPHELGHQLGLTDWYFLDYGLGGPPDAPAHMMPDGGGKVTHFQSHADQMMHDHGPRVYGEVDAAYLNMTWDKPRGYFGDYYFAVPRENFIRVLDVNSSGVPGATVEIYPRGAVIDKNGQPGEDHGVKYFPVIEDGKAEEHPVSMDPVIVGTTDEDGLLRLPNRPVAEVKTLNGFYRQANPFGNMNVVGERGDMLVKITKDGRICFGWLEITDFCVAWFRGHKDSYTTVIRTPYGSVSSPLPPKNVAVTQVDQNHVKVSWSDPGVIHETQYLDRATGFRVYRRISNQGLNFRPWFMVGTVPPDTTEFIVDLRQKADDVYCPMIDRFAVTTIGENSIESEMVEAPLLPVKQ